jgi:YbgC/YbaW family acyl-CoA thioester hydrolase
LTRFVPSDALAAMSVESTETPQARNEEPLLLYSRFETEMWVRPDDIDMYRHVHSSRYLDYVLTARIEQMERCYGIPISEFQKQGYGWFVAATQLNFCRPLNLGDRFVVRCWIENFTLIGLRVRFEIEHRGSSECCSEGWFDYVMVSLQTSRPVRIPEWIRAKFSI